MKSYSIGIGGLRTLAFFNKAVALGGGGACYEVGSDSRL